jgi:hypothetical protein
MRTRDVAILGAIAAAIVYTMSRPTAAAAGVWTEQPLGPTAPMPIEWGPTPGLPAIALPTVQLPRTPTFGIPTIVLDAAPLGFDATPPARVVTDYDLLHHVGDDGLGMLLWTESGRWGNSGDPLTRDEIKRWMQLTGRTSLPPVDLPIWGAS